MAGRRSRIVVFLQAALAMALVAPTAGAAPDGATAAPAEPVADTVVDVTPAADATENESSTAKRPSVPCKTSHQCADKLGYGNVCVTDRCQRYLDKRDILETFGLSSAQPTPYRYKLYPAIFPAIGYAPSLGFVFGTLGTFGMYLGDPDTTVMSSASILAMYTTENQLIIQLESTLLTQDNDWEFQGDWRFFIYNQDTFGLGTGTSQAKYGFTVGGWGETTAIPGGQPMSFNLVRFHEAVLRQTFKYFYVGGSYLLDAYFKIDDTALDLTATPPVVTSYFAYTTAFGFKQDTGFVSGVGIDVLYDSRDSTINPYRGHYAHVTYGLFPTWLGSSRGSTSISGDFRTYIGLDDAVPRNVLAIWVLASAVVTGRQPYLALPATGWDTQGVTGRGYVQGRFRGPSEVYGEIEWRFRITNNGLFGGVVFLNAETFSRPDYDVPAYSFHSEGESLFNSIKPAGGFGLRLLINRQARTNVRFDVAWGVDSFGFYMGAGEVF